MKTKQRFYVMLECKNTIEPKDLLMVLSEARPAWGVKSASLAAQHGVQATGLWDCSNCENRQIGSGFDVCPNCDTPRA